MCAVSPRSFALAYVAAGVAPVTASFVMTPVDSPRSSAYSRMVFNGSPSLFLRTAVADWEMTPLRVFWPVTIAVIPAAESLTICDTVVVSDRPMWGMRWT